MTSTYHHRIAITSLLNKPTNQPKQSVKSVCKIYKTKHKRFGGNWSIFTFLNPLRMASSETFPHFVRNTRILEA